MFTALLALAVVSCSGGVVLEPHEGPVLTPRAIAQASVPESPATAFEAGNPAEIALQASQLFFDSAQVVVLASTTQPAAVNRGSSLAITLGAPILLTAPPGQNLAGQDLADAGTTTKAGSLNTELLRLGTRALLTVGEVSLHQLDTTSLVVSPVPDSLEDLEKLTGLDLTEVSAPSRADAVSELAHLAIGEIYVADDLGTPATAYGTLPATLPAEREERVTILAGTNTRYYAGIATARAAGAQVFPGADPASDTAVVDHLALHPSRPVVGFGEEFSDSAVFDRLVASMQAGQLLPSGAQRVFRANDHDVRLVSVDAALALREKGIDDAAAVLELSRERAEAYERASGHTSVAAVDVTTSGNTPADLEYWASQVAEADQYLLLGFMAHGKLLDDVAARESLLARPEAGVRIRLDGTRTDAGELNDIIVYLRHLVREGKLPQKILIIDLGHDGEIANPDVLAASSGEVAVTVAVDDDATSAWRGLPTQLDPGTFWARTIGKEPQGEDEDEKPQYPPLRDILDSDDFDLLTYR